MSTRNENASNDKYIYRFRDESFSQDITYKKNVVEDIQKNCLKHNLNKEQIERILQFNTNNLNGEAFFRFVACVNECGYEVFEISKIG